jgi:5-methylcytosine-specific restriction endonuclease McrA
MEIAIIAIFIIVYIVGQFIVKRFPNYSQTDYDRMLDNPKWKRKREKILERDHHTCQHCGSHLNLQVHHKYYMRYPDGSYADPWDYPDEKLITLCETCHKKWHKKYKVKTYYRKWGVHYDENP